MAAGLQQTTQIVSGLSVIVAHGNYASTDSVQNVSGRRSVKNCQLTQLTDCFVLVLNGCKFVVDKSDCIRTSVIVAHGNHASTDSI